jgi:hypothetical protein
MGIKGLYSGLCSSVYDRPVISSDLVSPSEKFCLTVRHGRRRFLYFEFQAAPISDMISILHTIQFDCCIAMDVQLHVQSRLNPARGHFRPRETASADCSCLGDLECLRICCM